jgi:hypothetical protein
LIGLHRTPVVLVVLTACGGEPSSEAGSRGSASTLASAPASVHAWDSAGVSWTRSESHRYLLTRVYDGGDTVQRYMVHERFRRLCCFEAEQEVQSEVSLAAWPRLSSHATDPLWHAELPADDGAIWDVFYRAVRYGCCDSSDALTFFHVTTGGPAFVATARQTPDGLELPTISVPNSALRRHVAFLDRFAPADLPEADGRDEVVGVLQYGPPHGATGRYVVRAERMHGWDYRLVDLRFSIPGQAAHRTREDLWAADGSSDPTSLSGFAIEIVLYSENGYTELTLSIPVVGDRLDLAGARLPGGLVVEPAALAAAQAGSGRMAAVSPEADPGAALEDTSAAAAVNALYTRLIANRVSGAPGTAQLSELRPFLSDTLHTLLAAARALSETEARQSPDEKPPFVEGDLFSSLFEGPTGFRILGTDAAAGRRNVRIEFTYAGAVPAERWTERVVTVREDGRWVVTDVEYGGDWDFAPRGTLRGTLEEALRAR